MKRFVIILALLLCARLAPAAEVIPPVPNNHFNDYASAVSAQTATQLNTELANFERETSNQIVVAIFPKMQTDSSIEDYTTRVFTSWKVGQKDKNNGAVLFVFIQDRKMYITTGYGLEGALPDATCKQIIDQEIRPAFQQGNFDAGLTAGVHAMMAAARGEYRGTGKTVGDGLNSPSVSATIIPILLLVLIFYLANRATVYGRSGRRSSWYWGPGYWGGGYGSGGGWGGGGSWGGGGGGGGGTFGGGGGMTGGGGAGGSW